MKIDYYYKIAARRLNDRFKPSTIARHEAKWMKTLSEREKAQDSYDAGLLDNTPCSDIQQ